MRGYRMENKEMNETPCDYGECPYNAQTHSDCAEWCGIVRKS